MNEEAVEAVADVVTNTFGSQIDPYIVANLTLDALAPYVVLRSEMEAVGWRCDRIVGPKRWMKCAHSAPCGLVYRVCAGGGEDQ